MGASKLLAGLWLAAWLAHAADADPLNVRTGLWEITSTTHISGVAPVPAEVRERMTPQQRAEMDAAFRREAAAGPVKSIDRECIAEDDLERPFEPEDAQDCLYEITKTTRTSQEGRLVCSGDEYDGSGTLRVRAPTPERMTGSLELRLGEGEHVMTIRSQFEGRWLGPACGDEDDAEPDDADFGEEDESEE